MITTSNTKTNNPKVSIILPVFNVKNYVAEALESVINQTYTNLEIIVVDDGSNDGSEKICDDYAKKDKRIKLIRRKNGGVGVARNTGLDNFSGEFVTFLDPDDVFLPNAIEKSLSCLLNYNVDCVSFKFIACKKTKNVNIKKIPKEKIIPVLPQGKYSKKEILYAIAESKMDVPMFTKLSKREIWDGIRFPEGRVYEDLYIILQLIDRMKNVYIIDDVLALYRQRAGSITNTKSIQNTKDYIESWEVFEKFIEEHTPELFTAEQMQKSYETILSYFVVYYSKILSFCFYPEKKEVLNIIKEKISNLDSKVNISNCYPGVRIVHYMIYNHPKLLFIFFPICFFGYKIVKKLYRLLAK